MKKILTLMLALSLGFAVTAHADDSKSEKNQQKIEKRKQHFKDNPEAKAKHKEVKKECAMQCKVNKEKVKQCRKMHKADKSENTKFKKGQCISDSDKKCIRSCMKSKMPKDKMKKHGEDRKDK